MGRILQVLLGREALGHEALLHVHRRKQPAHFLEQGKRIKVKIWYGIKQTQKAMKSEHLMAEKS